MKKLLQLILFFGATLMTAVTAHAQPRPSDRTAYDFSFESLAGEPMPLAQYRGKALLIVNTASKCGFTPQYKGLQVLYDKYKSRGLVVIGVPSNDFGQQEPGTAQDIKKFCELNYGVTFPMTAKQVVTGDGAHPFYKWAYEVMGFGSTPKWNFHKYLIDTNGNMVDYFSSMTAPDSEKLTAAIEKALLAKP
jgi:glutathione peroxidase